MFAVDQLVQRAAEGGEERSVAKTISLLLKPEQASKLSLAAQIGEISLIPRNPDDEASAATPETTVDDLLTGNDTNSRAKEQGDAERTSRRRNANNGLLNAVRAAAAPKPPFRMEIVEAQGVREVLFDAETGRPIRPTTNDAAGPTLHSTPTAPAGPVPAAATGSGRRSACRRRQDARRVPSRFQSTSLSVLLSLRERISVSPSELDDNIRPNRTEAKAHDAPDHEGSTRMYDNHRKLWQCQSSICTCLVATVLLAAGSTSARAQELQSTSVIRKISGTERQDGAHHEHEPHPHARQEHSARAGQQS